MIAGRLRHRQKRKKQKSKIKKRERKKSKGLGKRKQKKRDYSISTRVWGYCRQYKESINVEQWFSSVFPGQAVASVSPGHLLEMQVARGPYPHPHTESEIMGMGPGIRFNKGLQEILMYTCLKNTSLLERSDYVNPVCRVFEMRCMCVGGPCQTPWQQGETPWPKGHVDEEQGLASGDIWE